MDCRSYQQCRCRMPRVSSYPAPAHPLYPALHSGNLDGQQRLIVKGRFLPKGFENVIRRYVNECVPTLGSSCAALLRDEAAHVLVLM